MFNNRIVIAQKELFISIFNQFGKNYNDYKLVVNKYNSVFRPIAAWMLARGSDEFAINDIVSHLTEYINRKKLNPANIKVSKNFVVINDNPFSDLTFGEEIDSDISQFSLIDPVWDVGNIARRSEDNGSLTGNQEEIPNRLLNEVQWLYLGWLGNFGKRNSFESQYIGRALTDFGHPKLGVLVTLKSLISRSAHTQRMYDDLHTLTFVNTPETLYHSIDFAVSYLINGLESGDSFYHLNIPDALGHALNGVNNTLNFINSTNILSSNEKSILSQKVEYLSELMELM